MTAKEFCNSLRIGDKVQAFLGSRELGSWHPAVVIGPVVPNVLACVEFTDGTLFPEGAKDAGQPFRLGADYQSLRSFDSTAAGPPEYESDQRAETPVRHETDRNSVNTIEPEGIRN